VQGQRLARAEVLAIVRQLAAALDAAHAAGIIHRDVKPANALWNVSGALVLTDFGIAKNMVTPANHTQVGMVVGTPVYLSPEQAQGQPLTPASDIYALGVVLYEMLSGTVPFDAPTPLTLLMRHVYEPPPALRAVRPDLPADVDLVVQQALSKDPAARFRSGSVLAQALEDAWPVSAATTIHHQSTVVWAGATPRAIAPQLDSQAKPEPAMPPTGTSAAIAHSAVPAPAGRGMLRFLGALLAVLLIGGVALAARNPQPTEAQVLPTTVAETAVPAPTERPAVTIAAPTAVPEPTAPPQPTAAAPTTQPAQVQAPQPAPKGKPGKDKPGKGKGRGKK
jgi:serine/threonine-protein kinase